jgi:hypothetical protein
MAILSPKRCICIRNDKVSLSRKQSDEEAYLHLKITRVKRKDQDPWNNLQTLSERKDITTDHTTSNKESAKESEILHLENI